MGKHKSHRRSAKKYQQHQPQKPRSWPARPPRSRPSGPQQSLPKELWRGGKDLRHLSRVTLYADRWALEQVQERLGYRFTRQAQLQSALTLRSLEHQRLEFLGDKVLGAVVARWLLDDYADWSPGTLTVITSRLVCNETLAHIAHQWGLERALTSCRLAPGQRPARLADLAETVIGALLLDSGTLRACSQVLRPTLAPLLSRILEEGSAAFQQEKQGQGPKRAAPV